MSMVRANPDSHRANYSLGFFLIDIAANTPDNSDIYASASSYHQRAAQLDPYSIRGHVGMIVADSQRGAPLNQAIVDELEYRLRNLPLPRSALDDFSMLADCFYRNYCKFEKSLLARLLTAISRNEATEAIAIQATLDQLGTAVATVFGQPEDGLAILYLARNKRQILTVIDLKLMELEIKRGNYTQAQRLIDEARQRGGNQGLLESVDIMADEVLDASQ
jgi:hypothetical protein